MMKTYSPRMISPPVRLFWAGWTSNTYELQNHGWDISASQNIYENSMQLALRHRGLDVRGLTNHFDFDYHRYHLDGYHQQREMIRNLLVQVMHFAPQFSIQTHNFPTTWVPVDAVPSIEHGEVHSMEDLVLFRSLPPSENDIVIEPPSFDDILQMALDHQAPKQKELRAKARQHMGAILRIAA